MKITDQELIEKALELSKLSAREFAEVYCSRDERTIRRWVAGDIGIPENMRKRLRWLIAISPAKRTRLIATLRSEPELEDAAA